ncbi:hypothetical protein DFP72DRAFT_828359, partial [Ephemerocybe angulata]
AARPLQTDLTMVDNTHSYFSLPNTSSINHIALFLTGTIPFPRGFSASRTSSQLLLAQEGLLAARDALERQLVAEVSYTPRPPNLAD